MWNEMLQGLLFSGQCFFIFEGSVIVQWWFGARAIPTVDLVGPEPNFGLALFRARNITGPACQVLLGWLTRSGPDGLSSAPGEVLRGGCAARIVLCYLFSIFFSVGYQLPWYWETSVVPSATQGIDRRRTNSSISRTRTETPMIWNFYITKRSSWCLCSWTPWTT